MAATGALRITMLAKPRSSRPNEGFAGSQGRMQARRLSIVAPKATGPLATQRQQSGLSAPTAGMEQFWHTEQNNIVSTRELQHDSKLDAVTRQLAEARAVIADRDRELAEAKRDLAKSDAVKETVSIECQRLKDQLRAAKADLVQQKFIVDCNAATKLALEHQVASASHVEKESVMREFNKMKKDNATMQGTIADQGRKMRKLEAQLLRLKSSDTA